MLGAFSTAAHVLLGRGCLIAPADRVGTLQNTSVFFASGFVWLVWDERVDCFCGYRNAAHHRCQRGPRPAAATKSDTGAAQIAALYQIPVP